MKIVQGVDKEAPTTVNERGGAQSKTNYRTDLLDALAFFSITKVLEEGARKYDHVGGFENWRNIPVNEHLNHLIIHVYAYLAGDTSDEHLSHAACRAIFALGVDLQTEEYIEKRQNIMGGSAYVMDRDKG